MTTAPLNAKVLVIHRYYWPDTPPYASILRAIVQRWRTSGHHVEVLTSQPSYKPELGLTKRPRRERVDEVDVRRISIRPDRNSSARRLFNVAYFPIAVLFRILFGQRYDVIMCSTAPPVILGLAVSLASRMRGADFVYHCMDIHPEIGAVSGEFRFPPVQWFLKRLDTGTCRRAARVVVLSHDMKQALADRDPALSGRIEVINNFELPAFNEPEPTSARLEPSRNLRIVFTGNLGRFQGLEELTAAVLHPDPELAGVQLVLMGEGAAKQSLLELVATADHDVRDRVAFLPHGSVSAAKALIRSADYGVVSLVPGVIRYAYPSKTATYLGESTPVFAIVESDSELARFVETHRIGFVAGDGDITTLRQVLLEMVRTADQDDDGVRQRCAAVWLEHFSSQNQLRRWDDLLAAILERKATA